MINYNIRLTTEELNIQVKGHKVISLGEYDERPEFDFSPWEVLNWFLEEEKFGLIDENVFFDELEKDLGKYINNFVKELLLDIAKYETGDYNLKIDDIISHSTIQYDASANEYKDISGRAKEIIDSYPLELSGEIEGEE